MFDVSGNEIEKGSDCIIEPTNQGKKPKHPGPTIRSHYVAESTSMPDFVPSSCEDTYGFADLGSDDDDQFEALGFVMPNGIKSRAKKKAPRKWYDENRQ